MPIENRNVRKPGKHLCAHQRFLFIGLLLFGASCSIDTLDLDDCADPTRSAFFNCIPVECTAQTVAVNAFEGTFGGEKLCLGDSFAVVLDNRGWAFDSNNMFNILQARALTASLYALPVREGSLIVALEVVDTQSNNPNVEDFILRAFAPGRTLPFSKVGLKPLPAYADIPGASVRIGGYAEAFAHLPFWMHLFSTAEYAQPEWAYLRCTRLEKNGNAYNLTVDVEAVVPDASPYQKEEAVRKVIAGTFSLRIPL